MQSLLVIAPDGLPWLSEMEKVLRARTSPGTRLIFLSKEGRQAPAEGWEVKTFRPDGAGGITHRLSVLGWTLRQRFDLVLSFIEGPLHNPVQAFRIALFPAARRLLCSSSTGACAAISSLSWIGMGLRFPSLWLVHLRRLLLKITFRMVGNPLLWIFLRIVPWAGEPLFWLAGRRKRASPAPIRRILFIALDNPGDLLLTTPCLTGLKERFASATITVLAGEWAKEILTAHPAVWNVIPYNAPWFARYVAHLPHRPLRPIRDLLRCLLDLWKGDFDLTVETRGEASHILLAYLSGAPRRVGYALRSTLPWLRAEAVAHLLTDRVPYAWDQWLKWHRAQYNVQVVAALGAAPRDPRLVLSISSGAQQTIEQFLQRHHVGPQDLLIGVHPGASVERKRWPPHRFAQVLDHLIHRWNARVVVLGGQEEEEVAQELLRCMVYPPILAVGQTTLLETAALIQRCRLVICNDSVVTHLASAVKTPAVTLSRSPSNFYAPYHTGGVALTHRLPCMNRGLPDGCNCPFSEHWCLQEVSPEEVLSSAEGLLGGLSIESPPETSQPIPQGMPAVSRPRSIRIGIDHRSFGFKSRYRGIGTYTAHLIQALAQANSHHEFVPFDQALLRRGTFPRADLIHTLECAPPFAPAQRSIVTVYDLIPLIFSRAYLSWRNMRSRFRFLAYYRFLKEVRQIVAISHHTKADLIQRLGISGDRIAVIYPGVSHCFHPLSNREEIAGVLRRYRIQSPFFLYVGSYGYRKNVPALLQAFAIFRKRSGQEFHLVLVGWYDDAQGNALRQYQAALGLEGHLHLLGYIPLGDLVVLYRGAVSLVFPSFYEGFGFPPLEAMACGTPVIASNASAIPEVTDGCALLVDPHDGEALNEAMDRMVQDRRLREDLIQRGLVRAKHFTWMKTAQETLALYERLLS